MTRWEIWGLAGEVMAGKYGNGRVRFTVLGERYEKVQQVVDKIIKLEDSESTRRQKALEKLARRMRDV